MNASIIFNFPNCIDYLRIILLIISCFYDAYYFIVFYMLSVSLDALDGKVARMYNQSTFLGACLDMIIDRTSTTLILMRIVKNDPSKERELIFYMISDILPHFIYLLYSVKMNESHKSKNNMILRIYYNQVVLTVLCFSSELYFILLYLVVNDKKLKYMVNILKYLTFTKIFFHYVHLFYGICGLSSIENDKDKNN